MTDKEYKEFNEAADPKDRSPVKVSILLSITHPYP